MIFRSEKTWKDHHTRHMEGRSKECEKYVNIFRLFVRNTIIEIVASYFITCLVIVVVFLTA